jgi:propionate CoA-transferase
MLFLPARSDARLTPVWKTITATEAAELIESASTIAVDQISDGVADAIARSFREIGRPQSLTLVYVARRSLDREHGLNRLAQDGLVRRMIGGQWYPVPALQKLAQAGRIEAYSLPSGVILRMLRATAAGVPAYVTRSGLGSFTDPRHGGGRLNQRSHEPVVHLIQAPHPEALVFPTVPIDVSLVDVGFREDTASLVMSRDGVTLAEAAHRSGGIVIGQSLRPGTIKRLGRGQIEAPDTLVDHIVVGEEPPVWQLPRHGLAAGPG